MGKALNRIRRAASLIIYWRDNQLVFLNYRTRRQFTADAVTAQMLDIFGKWKPPQHIYTNFPTHSQASLDGSLKELIDRGFLVRDGSLEAREDAHFSQTWSAWHPHAGLLHFGTKDARYTELGPETEQEIRHLLADSPQPPFFKDYRGKKRVKLPARPNLTGEFPTVLSSRRTHRQFSSAPLSLHSLSVLLDCTWGVKGFVRVPLLGSLPLKTSPSGGARHPGEVYVMALRVEGLSPGLYYYSPLSHSLVHLNANCTEKRAVEYCGNQGWSGGAAAIFLMTAVFPRSIWKYPHPRVYRVVLAEAGHLCQTFCLTATWLGLAPFCTMALADSLIEKDLGLDGAEETVLYLAGVGLPAATTARAVKALRRVRASL